jgi:hypothetical protein
MPDGQCHGSVGPQGKGSESRKMRKDGIVYVDLCERGGGMRLHTGQWLGQGIELSGMDKICRVFLSGKTRRTCLRALRAGR